MHSINCFNSVVADAEATDHTDDHAYSSKRPRLDNDLSDWKDSAENDGSDHEQQDDVDEYVNLKLSNEQSNSFYSTINDEPVFNIIKFWFDSYIQRKLPILSRVAIGVLSIPASSSSSERVFSTAGRVLEKRRNQLSSKSVDALLFMHSQHHDNK